MRREGEDCPQVRRVRVNSRFLKTRWCAGLYSGLIEVVDSLWGSVVSDI